MNRIGAEDILGIACAGTSASLLAKCRKAARLVHVDNGTLKKLASNQDDLDALMRIELPLGFHGLRGV